MSAAAPAAACAHYTKAERAQWPDWFVARLDEVRDEDFPKLAEVPQESAPLRDVSEWRAIERDLRAAGRDLALAERNLPADTSGVAAFEADARDAFSDPRAQAPE